MPIVPASVAGYGTADTANSVASVTLPKPAGVVAGDFLLCVLSINYDAPADITGYAITGWTQVAARNTPSGQYYPKLAIFRKLATGSEPANYTLTRGTGSGNGNLIATIVRFTGVDATNPIANAPSLVSGPQASGSFGDHTPIAAGFSLWIYANQNYRANRDTTVTWGGTGAKIGDQINVYNFQSLFGEMRDSGSAAGTRSITIGNWGGNTPSTVSSLVLREGVTAAPIIRDLDPVDIVPLTLEAEARRAFVARPALVDIAVDVPAPTAEVSQNVWADVDPVDITASVLGLDGEKIARPAPVDIAHTHPALDPAKSRAVLPVDVSHQHPQVTELVGNVPPPVDIVTTTVMPIDPAHQANLPAGPEVVVTPLTPRIQRVVNVPQVNVAVGLPPASVFSSDMRPIPVDVDVMPVTVAFSTDTTAAQRGVPIRVYTHPAIVMAQDIRTKQWLHMELPVKDLEITRTLSGAQAITGNFPAEVRTLDEIGLEPWATWIHVEQDDTIRASGILQPTKVDTGQKLALEAVGVTAYPHGIPYLGPDFKGVEVDPADCLRLIWQHLQSFTDGNLGVEVLGSTPVRIGTEERDVSFETSEGEQVEFTAGPYKLLWYEGTDCGSEQDKLAKEGHYEFIEVEFWNDPVKKDFVRHQIQILYPRAGTRRTELIFAQDENLARSFGPEENPDTYASHVVLLGKGEGTTTVRGAAGAMHPQRLRRVALVDDKSVASGSRANALATEEWYRRQASRDITEITIKAYHHNAPIGSFVEGDDIKVVGDVPHWGWISQYERVLGYTWSPDQELMRLQLRRSETFNYGSGEAVTE